MGDRASRYAYISLSTLGLSLNFYREGGPISTTPDDLLAEELEAYAAEAELNLDDLDVNEIFSLSDFEDDDVDMH